MTLPTHRRISHGRTHAQRWDAIDYACPVKGYVAAPHLGKVCKVIFAVVLFAIAAPIAVHFAWKVFS